jgi:hypothetical protein
VSVGLHHTAVRPAPLSAGERSAVDDVLARHDADRSTDAGGGSFAWGRFRDADDVLVEWSAGLPTGDEAEQVEALHHWLDVLSEPRAVLPGADSHVHLDDRDVPWSEEEQACVLPQG